MNFYSYFLFILCVILVEARKLTKKEAKLLNNNCGRYVPGYYGIDTETESGDEFKVLYGREANERQAPWSAAIVEKKRNGHLEHQGTGTLVSPYHIVTAAHIIGVTMYPKPDCVTGEMKNARFLHRATDYLVYLNTTCADERACGTTDGLVPRYVKSVYIRKGYVGDGCRNRESFNDVAVLELAEPVRFSSDIYPACMAKTKNINKDTIRLYGYGRDPSAKGTKIGILKYQDSKMVACPENYNSTGLFCANPRKQGLACDGDSGAGYIHKPHGRNSIELIGVLSAGPVCESVLAMHKAEARRKARRTQASDLIVDVSYHNKFFCGCCGLC